MITPDLIIAIILDCSWSMNNKRTATISAFNEYLASCKKDAKEKKQKVLFTLITFNDNVDVVQEPKNIYFAKKLTKKAYTPCGCTALLDAIGKTIGIIENKVWKNKSDTAVLCVILTDGEENVSKEHTLKDVKELIKHKEGQGHWTFVYLGADKDAWSKGVSMGFAATNSVQYDATNVSGTISALSDQTRSYTESIKEQGISHTDNFFAGADEAIFRGIDLDNLSENDPEKT